MQNCPRISKIETSRLILREWKDTDFDPFKKMGLDPRVMEDFPSLLSPERSEAMIKGMQTHFQEHGFTFWATELKSTGQFVGFIGLALVSFDAHFTPAVEIGWRLAYESWGQGYAPEGAIAALQAGFNQLKLSEIVSFTAVRNIKSQRVMQKIGMTHLESENFNHPRIPPTHPLCKHVLYRAKRETWERPDLNF